MGTTKRRQKTPEKAYDSSVTGSDGKANEIFLRQISV